MYVAFLLFLGLAGVFFIGGIVANTSIPEFVAYIKGTKPGSQVEYGSSEGNVLFLLNSTMVSSFVRINYTLYGADLSVGQPVWLLARASVVGPISRSVWGISVQPENTFATPYVSVIELSTINGTFGQTFWSGSSLVEFNTAGALLTTISVAAQGEGGKPQYSTFKDFVPDITIGPSGSGQVKFFGAQTVSLTLFILFFASLDIAVKIYDHSYEDLYTSEDRTEGQHNQPDDDLYCPY